MTAGVVLVTLAIVSGSLAVDAATPAASRPPEEARFRPVTLPSNSPMTPADPLAAPFPRDAGARGRSDAAPELGLRDDVVPGGALLDLALAEEFPLDEPLPDAPAPSPDATSRPTPRPTPRPTAWRLDPEASWYGPGFYGKRTACGLAMTKTLIGVAHRSLPCGTLVVFRYGGRTVTAPVVDRGPYIAGRTWDLTAGLAIALDHLFTGPIEWRLK